MDDAMKSTIETYIDKCKAPGYKEELEIPIPNQQKLHPSVLQSLSANAHISMESRQGSLHIKHNPNFDELVTILGIDDASEILSFIIRSKVNKQETPQSTFKTKPIEDKEKRRSLHLFCKLHYPFVKTSTDNNAILLTIRGVRKRIYIHHQNRKRSLHPQGISKKPRLSTILQFTLKKTNMELLSLKTRLCQLLHCDERSIHFAGIKDKKAVTTQFGTIRGVTPEAFLQAASELPAIDVGHFQYVEKELQVGELWGNHFIITLHGVEATEEELEKAVKQMREHGYCKERFEM